MTTERSGMSLAYLKSVLSYDPLSGEFVWLKRMSMAVQAGDKAGCICRTHGYRKIRMLGFSYHAHKLAMMFHLGYMPDCEVDHINGNQSDDRLCNLRLASHAENMRNQRLRYDNKSGYKGVFRGNKCGTWLASVTKDGKRHTVHGFRTKELAYEFVSMLRQYLHGEFARD